MQISAFQPSFPHVPLTYLLTYSMEQSRS